MVYTMSTALANPTLTPTPTPTPTAPRAPTPGHSLSITGEVFASEDLVITGRVAGKIEVRGHTLTIGEGAKVKADVVAKELVVLGELAGSVTALEKLDIRDHGSLEGDVATPRLAISDGARFSGKIDMGPRVAR